MLRAKPAAYLTVPAQQRDLLRSDHASAQHTARHLPAAAKTCRCFAASYIWQHCTATDWLEGPTLATWAVQHSSAGDQQWTGTTRPSASAPAPAGAARHAARASNWSAHCKLNSTQAFDLVPRAPRFSTCPALRSQTWSNLVNPIHSRHVPPAAFAQSGRHLSRWHTHGVAITPNIW
jgi:hypothetical protein